MSDSAIQPGGAPPPEPNALSGKVTAATSVAPGSPLYAVAADNTLGLANAGSGTTAYCVGLALNPGEAGDRVQYRYAGPLTLTEAEWTAVLNTGTLLTPGAPYYVSQGTAGKITKSLPGSGIVQQVGVAVTPLSMLIERPVHTVSS